MVAAAQSRLVHRRVSRFVLTAQTEVTDRMLIFGPWHLRTVLAQCEAHSADAAPSQPPASPGRPDHPVANLSQEPIKRQSVLCGLINEYERAV